MATVQRQLVDDDALSAGARAVVLDPALLERLRSDQLLQIGRELRSRDPELALRAHVRAVAATTNRNRARALISLASTQRRNGKPSEALDSISEALELDDSASVSLTGNTCRVGAFRDLEQLAEARELGEQLERLHPDDPKVCRALAAVYRDLSDGPHELAAHAQRLFTRANELDALDDEGFSFADLSNVTPQLEALLDAAGNILDPGGQSYCAFDHWIEVFRPQLDAIASSQRADPRLGSDRAYSLVALLVYRRLPPCRDCGRIYEP